MSDDSKPTFSKTDARFWCDRLFKRGESNDWNVQIGFAGQQERFPLKTPNKETAAAKARDIYLSLHSKCWDQTRATYKPWQNQVQKIASPTVGEFLTTVEAHGGTIEAENAPDRGARMIVRLPAAPETVQEARAAA